MKKSLIITVLCVIVAAIIVVTLVLFVNTFNKPTDDQSSKQPEAAPSTDVNDTQADLSNDNTDANQDEGVSGTDNDQDSSTDNQDSSVSNNGDASQPDNSGTDDTSNVVMPENVGKSYKDFSLTKGMDARAAYEYLTLFLESKYSILTNKQNKVSSDYVPTDLVVPSGCQYPMESVAANALVKMLSAAKKEGISDLVLYSGYRTYASQKNKYETRTNNYLSQGYSQEEAEAKAGEYIAPPGASEHHTGLAADVCSSAIVNKYGYLSDDFDSTKEYQWMKENCAEFGFIVRYQKGKESITGYSYEPWHIRYLGTDHATACTELGLTYEEYHALLIKYRDQAKADAGV